MKTSIFNSAISNRSKIRFLYGMKEITLEPYYVSVNKKGKKVLFGRLNGSNSIKVFEFCNIYNIKVLQLNKFSPIIPIIASYN